MNPDRAYEVLARAWVYRGGDECELIQGIANTIIERTDLFDVEAAEAAHTLLDGADDLLTDLEKASEQRDYDWIEMAATLADRALGYVGLSKDDDEEASWGDGLWLNEYDLLSTEELNKLRAVLPAIGPLFTGHLILWQDVTCGVPGPDMEVWQLGEEPYPRVRRFVELP